MTDENDEREQALRTALEDFKWGPLEQSAVDRLNEGIEILRGTADADSAKKALSDILADPLARHYLEKAALRFWEETHRPRTYRLSSKEKSHGLRQLIDEVAGLKVAFGFADHRAQKFAAAASRLGLVPEAVNKVRGGAAFFKIKEYAEALEKIEAALIEEYGEEKGGVPISETIMGRPFDHLTETLASLWREAGRDFRRAGMRDFEKVLNALMEGLTGKNMPKNRWKELKRELKK